MSQSRLGAGLRGDGSGLYGLAARRLPAWSERLTIPGRSAKSRACRRPGALAYHRSSGLTLGQTALQIALLLDAERELPHQSDNYNEGCQRKEHEDVP